VILIQPFIPAQTIAEDAAVKRFAENPSVKCRYCGKDTTTGLDHLDCELKSFINQTDEQELRI
jgi:hypothetical protein